MKLRELLNSRISTITETNIGDEKESALAICHEVIGSTVIAIENRWRFLSDNGYEFADPPNSFVKGDGEFSLSDDNGFMPLSLQVFKAHIKSLNFSQAYEQHRDMNSKWRYVGMYYTLNAMCFFANADVEIEPQFLELCVAPSGDVCGVELPDQSIDPILSDTDSRSFLQWGLAWGDTGGFLGLVNELRVAALTKTFPNDYLWTLRKELLELPW